MWLRRKTITGREKGKDRLEGTKKKKKDEEGDREKKKDYVQKTIIKETVGREKGELKRECAEKV